MHATHVKHVALGRVLSEDRRLDEPEEAHAECDPARSSLRRLDYALKLDGDDRFNALTEALGREAPASASPVARRSVFGEGQCCEAARRRRGAVCLQIGFSPASPGAGAPGRNQSRQRVCADDR